MSCSTVRVAQFNVSMSFDDPFGLDDALCSEVENERFSRIAATLQQVRPDVVLLCEFDHQGDTVGSQRLRSFQECFLERPQFDKQPIYYPHAYLATSNTGVSFSTSLTKYTCPHLPEDGVGFGHYPGHYNFVVLSRFPIQESAVQSWQHFCWHDLYDSGLPSHYYLPEIAKELPLSSKNHLLIPIEVDSEVLHLVCSHPTPPVFDGEERRNYYRNRDELRLLKAIIEADSCVLDDAGKVSALTQQSKFVILGDLNNDAFDGDGDSRAMRELLYHSRVNRECAIGRLCPRSRGAFFHGLKLQRRGVVREGKSAFWTHLNGMRLDYVLPSANLKVKRSGVFWPEKKKEALRHWFENEAGKELPAAYSDHRLVWVDILVGTEPML